MPKKIKQDLKGPGVGDMWRKGADIITVMKYVKGV
jgi:hypothetical protein